MAVIVLSVLILSYLSVFFIHLATPQYEQKIGEACITNEQASRQKEQQDDIGRRNSEYNQVQPSSQGGHPADQQSLRRLSECVAKHESGNYTSNRCVVYFNCHGFPNQIAISRGWAEIEDSHLYFMDLWQRAYSGQAYPTERDARKYLGHEDTSNWLASVNTCLNTIAYEKNI